MYISASHSDRTVHDGQNKDGRQQNQNEMLVPQLVRVSVVVPLVVSTAVTLSHLVFVYLAFPTTVVVLLYVLVYSAIASIRFPSSLMVDRWSLFCTDCCTAVPYLVVDNRWSFCLF